MIAEACDKKVKKPFYSRISLFCLGVIVDPLALFSKALDKIGLSYPPINQNVENDKDPKEEVK